MKRFMVITALFLVSAAALPVAADDCTMPPGSGPGWKFINMRINYLDGVAVDPGPYDFCYGGMDVTGNLKGQFKSCFYGDEFVPSDAIFGDGIFDVEADKFHQFFESDSGNMEWTTWSWWVEGTGVEHAVTRVVGGTGKYEGVVGILTWPTGHPSRTYFFGGNHPVFRTITGYLCTADN
jgi:hypothetical protein